MLGHRIKQARIAVGMTQDEVVAALATHGLPLTKSGLSKYERGGSTPRPTVLRGLAKVLGVNASFLLEEPSTQVQWLAFRKTSRMSEQRQGRIRALAKSHLKVTLALQRALNPSQEDFHLPPRTTVRSFEDAEKAAESLRACWRLGDQPIKSVAAAIEDGGGVVVECGTEDDLFDSFAGWANGTVPVVVVSSAASDDRRRFSLSCELGRLFMEVCKSVDASTREKLVHRFAAALLVTATTARRGLGRRRRHLDFYELAVLKQRHGLSMQAWILRAADLNIIKQSHARTLLAKMGARGWRRREPVKFEGEERPRKALQLAVRAQAESLINEPELKLVHLLHNPRATDFESLAVRAHSK